MSATLEIREKNRRLIAKARIINAFLARKPGKAKQIAGNNPTDLAVYERMKKRYEENIEKFCERIESKESSDAND